MCENVLNIDEANCSGCGACANVCPRDAISMKLDEYGFLYPHIDATLCTECSLCAKTCEKVNSSDRTMPQRAFAASHRDKQVLLSSSSGGVFSALAQHFIDNGGVVCGCVLDEELNAVHICTDKENDLFRIRKSKYLQSDVGLVYREVKRYLKENRLVLFTGTPCQVSALYAVIGKKYENLTTMDLICHGVPGRLVFDQFIKYLEKRYKTKIIDFDFRSKKYGWPRYTMSFTDSKNRIVNIGKTQEFYLPSFTGGNIIRESCLSCPYACADRIADITIGDLWGYEKIDLKMDVTKGASVFTINNSHAEKWLLVLSAEMVIEEIDYNIAVNANNCLHQPTIRGEKRDLYMESIKNGTIEELALRYRKKNKKRIIIEKIKLMIPSHIFAFIKKRRANRR